MALRVLSYGHPHSVDPRSLVYLQYVLKAGASLNEGSTVVPARVVVNGNESRGSLRTSNVRGPDTLTHLIPCLLIYRPVTTKAQFCPLLLTCCSSIPF